MKLVLAYVDANILIECRPLRDFPWRTMFAGATVRVVVCKTAFDELDDFKDRPGASRAKRQRAAERGRALDELFANDNTATLAQGAQITYDDCALPEALWREHDLDPSVRDHRIVAHALLRKSREIGADVVFLSLDGGAMRAARGRGLLVVRPPDDLVLKPALDEVERELKATKAELLALRSAAPVLSATFADGATDAVFDVRRPRDPDATAAVRMETLRAVFADDSPMERHRRIIDDSIGASAPGARARYAQEKAAWLDEIAGLLPALVAHANAQARTIPVDLSARNDGGVLAKGARVTVRASSGRLLVELPEAPYVPKPPQRPRSVFDAMIFPPTLTELLAGVESRIGEEDWEEEPTGELRFHVGNLRHANANPLPRFHLELASHEADAAITLSIVIEAHNVNPPASVTLSIQLRSSDEPVTVADSVGVFGSPVASTDGGDEEDPDGAGLFEDE
jgi:hypothetical protein